jgi:hypothetical protein
MKPIKNELEVGKFTRPCHKLKWVLYGEYNCLGKCVPGPGPKNKGTPLQEVYACCEPLKPTTTSTTSTSATTKAPIETCGPGCEYTWQPGLLAGCGHWIINTNKSNPLCDYVIAKTTGKDDCSASQAYMPRCEWNQDKQEKRTCYYAVGYNNSDPNQRCIVVAKVSGATCDTNCACSILAADAKQWCSLGTKGTRSGQSGGGNFKPGDTIKGYCTSLSGCTCYSSSGFTWAKGKLGDVKNQVCFKKPRVANEIILEEVNVQQYGCSGGCPGQVVPTFAEIADTISSTSDSTYEMELADEESAIKFNFNHEPNLDLIKQKLKGIAVEVNPIKPPEYHKSLKEIQKIDLILEDGQIQQLEYTDLDVLNNKQIKISKVTKDVEPDVKEIFDEDHDSTK